MHLNDFLVRGEGKPLVLLHSSLSSKAQWSKLIRRLGSDYRCLAIDLMGYGSAAYPADPENFAFHQEAERVEKLAREVFCDAPFHLIGHSVGGVVALDLAHRYPQRVLSLSCYEPVAFYLLDDGSPESQSIASMAARIQEGVSGGGTPEQAVKAFMEVWSGQGDYARLPRRMQGLLAQRARKLALDFDASHRSAITQADLMTLRMPKMLIRGRHSPAASKAVIDVLADLWPDVQVQEVAAGHMGPVSHADEVNRLLDDFLSRVSSPI